MDAITKDLQKPAPWTLLYADDVMLASEDKSELESQVQTWSDRLAMFGLRLNVKKTEYLTTDSTEPGTIKINGTELTLTTTFKYVGSAIASDGSLGFETKSRVNAAWLKWRSMTGVLCERTSLSVANPRSTEPSSGRSQSTALNAGLRPKRLKPVSA
ncbi:unnamed protein product [Haemonchus placei]|uniref:Reverse transcriptase domain-containing protein n=1 Tax=Haemonchus placei TaxID=6290 RepID=A0A0N4WEQ7_HAEPC|nr:unnamed protein product [Haemonchus placei]